MSTVVELDAGPPYNGIHGSNEVQKSAGICTVPEKYQGTAADKYDMASLGKEQTLRVCLPTYWQIDAIATG